MQIEVVLDVDHYDETDIEIAIYDVNQAAEFIETVLNAYNIKYDKFNKNFKDDISTVRKYKRTYYVNINKDSLFTKLRANTSEIAEAIENEYNMLTFDTDCDLCHVTVTI